MNASTRLALIAATSAIAITTAMDTTGYSVFSALPLIALLAFFWWRGNLSHREVGFTLGKRNTYWVALIYPVVVIGLLAGVAYLAGAAETTDTAWVETARHIALAASVGVLMVAITEEGFFRGVLWALLERGGLSPQRLLGATTALFVLWHLSAVLLDTGFNPPRSQLPVYLVNAVLLGYIWGSMRLLSGSVWVPAVCHSLWNALAYELFAFGEKVGALGVVDTWLYAPEVGLGGLVLNGLVALLLWRYQFGGRKPE